MTFLHEYLTDVPSGLIACRCNGIQTHILGISPRCIDLRTPEPLPAALSMELSLLNSETGGYLRIPVHNLQPGEARRKNGAVLSRVFFEDPACTAAIRRSLNDLARYVEIRSTEGASAYGRSVCAYPDHLDEIISSSPQAQRDAWYAHMDPIPDPGPNHTLAVSLNCRLLWELYLETPIEDFMPAYASSLGIPRRILPRCTPQHLYIGNESCRFLFPDAAVLERIAAKAAREDLALTLVGAPLRAGEEDFADALLNFARQTGAELEINDWGMLERAQQYREHLHLLLGSLLNRRRKDPRMAWKRSHSGQEALLAQNSLNDPAWIAFLRRLGIERFEYESCGLPLLPPEAACSLHLPFYRTNSSLWCPLAAVCLQGDRGAQRGMDACPRWCERNMLLYPDHLKLEGRGNSLLALDDHPALYARSFDRWVLNF